MTVQEWLGEDNALGKDIWQNKYRYKDESFDEWLDRISGNDLELKKLITEKKFLFGGRILANRGLQKYGRKISYSNCYVIEPPKDNLESIFACATKLARTYSYGGGCGIDISNLSPKGAKVNNAAKETSGSVSFMDLYSLVTELIGQNGRRGALMISIACDHPDLEDFIKLKSDLSKVTKANISIRITDKFMKAVKEKENFLLKFIRIETGEVIVKPVDAYSIFHDICKMNWDYAEPGMLFWNRIEESNILSEEEEFHYAGVNPCAEEPLPAGGSCLLGSLNLSEFVDEKLKTFDYLKFHEAVDIAVKALNDVLDEGLPLHPLEEQRESVKNWRQIGLGIFGLADALIKLGIKYGSKEAVKLCDSIGYDMAVEAILESNKIADKKGSYNKFTKKALESKFIRNHSPIMDINTLRNSQLLTIAPTGSISTMLGVSGGIEPIYANSYERKTESLHGYNKKYKVYTPIVDRYMKKHGLEKESDLPDYFVTAKDIDYKNRIDMQSAWQKHIDASISSTINVPNSFTVENVENLYIYAWEKGLKGVTIYRDNCKRSGVLSTTNTNDNDKKNDENNTIIPRGFIIKADDNCVGRKRTLYTGCGTLHCEAFFDPDTGELLETYFSKGSSGGCNNFMIGLSRMISLSARGGVDIYSIVDQLISSGTCPSYAVRSATKHNTSKGSCCPVAIGYALIDMYTEMQNELNDDEEYEENKIVSVEEKTIKDKRIVSNDTCPQCGEKLVFESGCNVCKNCGWSKCD